MNERYEGREDERSRAWGSRERNRGFYPGEFGSQHPRERSGEGEWGRRHGGDYDHGSQGRYGQSGEVGDYSRYGSEYGRGDYGRSSQDYGRGDWGRAGDYGRFDEEGRTPYYGAMGYRDYGSREHSGRGEFGRQSGGQYGQSRGQYEGQYRRGGYGVESGQGSFGYGASGYGDYGRSAYGYGDSGRGREEFGRGAYGEQGERGRGGFLSRLFRRGPKGYTRSDERLKEDVSERLWNADDIDSSEVTVEVREARVILAGTVPERWMRHEIENIADDCPGVKDVENNIRIERQQSGGQQMGATQSQGTTGTQQQSGIETGARGASGSSRSRPS